MSLIEKFAAVEIKVDARISEQDKQFCERQQAAYTAALYGFQELTFFWEDMLSAQKALLGEPDSPPRTYNQYLVPDGDDGPKITIQRLRVQIDTLHRRFIQKLAGYFQSAYNVKVDEKKIVSELLLPRPPKSKKQDLKEYLLWASSVQLHYEDIVVHILSRFDRRTPSEQSLQELCRRCNETVWCNYTHKAKFERKYAIISFLNFFCSFRNDKEYWTFTNSMKAILPCAAHFETGALNEYPAFFQARRSMGPTAAINWIFQDVRNWCSCGCLRTGEWISAFPARTMPVSLSMLILAEAIRNLLGRWWHEVPVPSSPFQSGAAPNAQ